MPSAPASSEDGDFIHVRPFTAVIVAACVTVGLTGVVSLAGWALELSALDGSSPARALMPPNTALTLLLLAAAVWFTGVQPKPRWSRALVLSCSVFTLALGLATIVQYLSGRDLGVDHVLFRFDHRFGAISHVSFPGGVEMMLLSSGLIAFALGANKRVSDIFALLSAFYGVLAISGFVFGAEPTYGIPGLVQQSGMTLFAALAFTLLAVGLLCCKPIEGVLAIVASRRIGGYMARRFLLAAVLIPFVGVLVREGEHAGMYSPVFGSSMLVSLAMAIAVLLILIIGSALNASDAARHRAVEALERSHDKYRMLIDQASEAIFLAGDDGTLRLVNNAGAHMLGYQPHEMIGRKTFEFLLPEERAVFLQSRARLEKGETVISEYHAVRKDGRVITVGMTTKVIGSDIWQTIARDVTDLKALADQQRFLADMTSLLVEPVGLQARLENIARQAVGELGDWVIVDIAEPGGSVRRAAVIHHEPAKQELATEYLQQTGGRPNRELGVEEVLASRRPLLVRDIDERWLSEHFTDEARKRTLRQLGALSYVIVPLEARGSVLGTLSFFSGQRNYSDHDLSFAQEVARRTALSADNARLYESAQRAIRTREDVLAVVSHDLKNPLNAINAGSDLVLKKLLPESGARPEAAARIIRALVSVRRAGDRATHLIKDLLDFAKIDSGKLRVDVRAERVEELCDEARTMMMPMADEREVTLLVAADAGLIARCDRHRVLQVLSNLIGNAIKFNRPRGLVDVRAVRDRSGKMIFSVRDNGPGISPANAAHIFERYWQADDMRKQGTGLGLAIAKGIVEAHGGQIWMHSKVGEGTTFFFTLPLVEPAPLPIERALEGAAEASIYDSH